MKRAIIFLYLFVLLIGLPRVGSSDLDGVQLKLLEQFEHPLRWDNIVKAPLWVSGAEPAYSLKLGMHTTNLKPGCSVSVMIPAYEIMRVFNPYGPLPPDALEISVSHGTGLQAYLPLQTSLDGKSLLLSPNEPEPLVCRVSRPVTAICDINVALFVSRRDTLGEIAPYRRQICLPGSPLRLTRSDKCGSEKFYRLAANSPVEVTVKGPCRIAIESRIVCPSEDTLLQDYRFECQLNGVKLAILESQTAPENTKTLYVKGCSQVLGRLRRGFLEIPCGNHRLTLIPTAEVITRLLRQGNPDYLLAGLNQPKVTAAEVRTQLNSGFAERPSWSFDEEEVEVIVADPKASPTAFEKVADRLRIDNSRRQGALVGTSIMESAGRQRPDAPEVRNKAQEFQGFNTGFRNLLPSNKVMNEAQQFGWFIDRKLKKFDETDLVVAARHMNAYLDKLPSGYFVTLPVTTTPRCDLPDGSPPLGSALHYFIPKRFSPTRLRVTVEKNSSPQDFVITMVGGNTIHFRLIPGSEGPEDKYRLSLGEAGLELLRFNRPHEDFTTLGGPFGLRRMSAPLRDVATYELPLPPEVSEIFAWASASGSCPVRLSLQYRESNPFSMSERDYIETESLLGCEDTRYKEFLQVLSSSESLQSRLQEKGHGYLGLFDLAKKDVKSFWLPLVYLMKSQKTTFVTPVIESTKNLLENAQATGRLSQSELNNFQKSARKAEQDHQWLIALEKWSAIYHGASGETKAEAALKMTKTLQSMGENFLAEMFLRRLYIQPDGTKDASLSKAAFDQLREMYVAIYAQNNDPESLLSLYSTEVLSHPRPQIIRELCSVLIDAGHYELALLGGMALPKPERPVRELLRACRYLGWFTIYENLIAQLSDSDERNYWLAFRITERGGYAEAGKLLAQAGAPGVGFANAIKSGLAIQNRLRLPSINERLLAVTEWESWQTAHPGPYQWAEEPGMINDYDGGSMLYSVSRDLYFKGFKGSASRPVRAKVYGPVNVRVIARPIHDAKSTKPLNGWMRIRTKDEEYITPINNNMSSQGLSIVGDSRHQPGQEVQKILSFGPGLHDIEITGGDIPIIVRLQAQRPEINLGILPPLTPETVEAALRGPVNPMHIGVTDRISCMGRTCLVILPFPFEDRPVYMCDRIVMESVRRGRMVSTVDGGYWNQLLNLRRNASHGVLNPNGAARKRAQALARGDIQSAVRHLDEKSPQDVFDAMSLLVYWGERQPTKLAEAEARAQRLCERHPAVPQVRELLARLSQKTSWEPVSLIQSSLGMRFVRLDSWEPESDMLRVRKALIETVKPGERIVTGRDKVVLVMENVKVSDLELKLSLVDLPFLPPAIMKGSYQMDDEKPHDFSLSGSSPTRTWSFKVPTGRHRVSLAIKERYANQFLKARFCEIGSGGRCLDLVLTKSDERLYYVATHQKPVKAEINGPAWVRIDELRDGEIRVAYRFFEHGWHELKLTPDNNKKEGLFRIHRRIVAPGEEELTIPRPIEFHFAAVPGPVFSVGSPPEVGVVELNDQYFLGKQQDGTWSLTTTYRKPADINEPSMISTLPKDEAKFVEVAASYRYFEEYLPGYAKGTFLSRLRETGGPTVGFLEDAVYYPRNFPYNFGLNASLYIQKPGAKTFGFFGGGSTEYCGTIEGRVTQVCEITPKLSHLPSLSIFGRTLSMQNNDLFPPWWVDNDVFTKYKAEHQSAIIFGEYFGYKPWLDTLWFSRVSAQTNENCNPIDLDNFKIDVGWRQLLGPFQMDVTYLYSYYFADSDRVKSSDRHILELELSCDRWMVSQRRLQLLCRTDFDFDHRSVSGWISLSYFFGEGRGWRDFRPAEADFLEIKNRRVPQVRNNHMTPSPEQLVSPIFLRSDGR